MTETKTCTNCQTPQPLTNYWKKSKDRLDNLCKTCRQAKNRAYQQANKDKIRETKREWHRRNTHKVANARKARRQTLTPEQKAELNHKTETNRQNLRNRRITEYLQTHQTPPYCACGCGNHVKFNQNGKPNTYLNGHHTRQHAHQLAHTRYTKTQRIPIQKLRTYLHQTRTKNNWTNKQLAQKAGLSHTHLHDLLYSKTKFQTYGLDPTWTENLLRRLHNLPAPPTTHQLKQHQKIEQRYTQTTPHHPNK